MNISTIIEEALAAVSSKLPNGYPNLNNAYHMMLVKEELSKRIDPKLVSLVLEAGKDDDYRAIVPGGGQYALKKKLPKGWKMGDDVPSNIVKFTKDDKGNYNKVEDPEKKKQQSKPDEDDKDRPNTPQEDEALQDAENGHHAGGTGPSAKSIRNSKNGKTFKRVQEAVDAMPDGEKKENAKDLMRLMTEYCDARTPADRENLIKEMVEKGYIKRNNTGSNTVKFYIDPKTGLDYKAFGQDTALHKSICAYDKKNRDEGGEGLVPFLKQADLGGKKVNPGGIFGKDGIYNTKIEKTENGVNVGGVEYKKSPHPDKDPKLKQKLEESKRYLFREIYGKGTSEYDNAVKAIERNNEIINKIETVLVEGGELEVFNPFHPDPPIEPDSPENIKKLKDQTEKRVADKLQKELESIHGKPLSKEQQEIIDELRKLKDVKPEDYEKTAMKVMSLIAKHPDTAAGLADLAETFSYTIALSKGKAAFLPSAGNFPLGDVMAAATATIDPEKDSPEEIANKVQLIVTSIENRSVKKGGGAASSSHKKNSLTKFKSKQAATDTQDMTQENYDRIWSGDIAEAEKRNSEYAKRYGLNLSDPDYVAGKNRSVSAALDAINRKRAAKDLPPLTGNEQEEMVRKLEAYYDNGKIYQKAYNDNMESQLFTNDNYMVDKEGNVSRDSTDGICTVSEVKFEFNVGYSHTGKPTNKVPTRFHNVNRCEV